jgi:hypothetical protein
MDFQRSTNPTHRMRLEDAVTKDPSLKGQFDDILVERMGVRPTDPAPGVASAGLTPSGVAGARDLLRPGGTLRILQEPTGGQTLAQIEADIRGMLSNDFTNISVTQHTEGGIVHLLVTATKR